MGIGDVENRYKQHGADSSLQQSSLVPGSRTCRLFVSRKQDIPCRRTDTIIQVLIVCTVLNIVSINAHSRPEAIGLSRLIIINR